MTPLEELALLANEKSRCIFVAEHAIDLSTSQGRNCVYVLELYLLHIVAWSFAFFKRFIFDGLMNIWIIYQLFSQEFECLFALRRSFA